MAIEWVDVSDGNESGFRAMVGVLALDVFAYGTLGWLAEIGIPDKREKQHLSAVIEKIPRPSSERPLSLAEAQAWAITAAQRAVQPLIDQARAEGASQERARVLSLIEAALSETETFCEPEHVYAPFRQIAEELRAKGGPT